MEWVPEPKVAEKVKDVVDGLAGRLIDCYFSEGNGQLVKHQTDSFNDFINRKLEQIINGFNPIDICNTYLTEQSLYQYIVSIEVINPVLGRPVINEKDGSTKIMHPNDARLRNITYAAALTVDLNIITKNYCTNTNSYLMDTKCVTGVSLGRIPIMVRSRYCMLTQVPIVSRTDECPYDYGGYFIVNGSEKTVISQDRISENNTYVFLNSKASCYSHIAEIRSVQESKFGVPKTLTIKLASKSSSFGRQIKVCMHNIKHDIPIFVMFRALGVESDSDIIDLILQSGEIHLDKTQKSKILNELSGCVEDSNNIRTQSMALAYMASHMTISQYSQNKNQKYTQITSALKKDLLPHIGTDPVKKAVYIAYMVNKLISCFVGIIQLDDRDSYLNKRLDTPGVLLANLFRLYYGRVIKDLRVGVQKEINHGTWRATHRLINIINKSNVHKLMKQTIIESGLRYGLATGNWGVKTSRMRQGVAQVLNRMTYVSMLSHLRRVNTPIENTGKLVQPRKLHPTQWGIICPSETPEGASVGLVKNLALTVSIPVATSSDYIRDLLPTLGVELYPDSSIKDVISRYSDNTVKIMVNGDIIGTHENAPELKKELHKLRRQGIISPYTSISWVATKLMMNICTEGGRFVRPLLVVEDGNLLLDSHPMLKESLMKGEAKWHDLILHGVVEYMDVHDCNSALIAIKHSDIEKNPSYTHCELSPSAILGVVGGSIPYADHNQAPRNTYQSAMGKQAIGVYASNYRHRMDTMSHVLNYPQIPLVSTHTSRIMNCNNLPYGMNVIVAIASFTGFNQEDSVIANSSAFDRGMFSSTFFHTFREQNNKNHSTGEEEYFCKPDSTTTRGFKPYNYDKLGMNGFIPENTAVNPGDVIIGKVMPQKQGNNTSLRDTSVALKSSEHGIVDCNSHSNGMFTNTTGEGYTFCKVRLRQERTPTIGDKVSCYTDDHDVFTRNRGWISIAKVTMNDEIASLGEDGTMTYQFPVAVQSYNHRGEMVKIIGDHVDLFVTPNHRVLNALYDTYSRSKVSKMRMDTADSISGVRVYMKTSNTIVNIHRNKVMHILGNMIASYSNPSTRIPQWILSKNPNDLMSFADGFIEGIRLRHYVSSYELASQMQGIISICGISCDIVTKLTSDGPLINLMISENVFTLADAYKVKVSGAVKVYCCTVPNGIGAIMVRRNGIVCLSGNSRHGQKGTIGMMYREEDMPYTSSGLIPALIINPHAIPSRMTIGQLMEALQSKACAMKGDVGDATPFTSKTVEDFSKELEELGAERYGNEVMYNPRSGEQIDCTIFMCPTYYQRLKHMVQDKVHSRSANGPVVLLTRQPAEGRARDGGLRLGEMELECLWAHGAMSFLKERFMDCSDNYVLFICPKCHSEATKANAERNMFYCKKCKNMSEFHEIRIPYAYKLVTHEVQSMSINTKFVTSS